jgi:hypothetical protein
LSVEEAHERSISLVETAFAARSVGTDGGVPSTVTVAWAVELPFIFVAVKVYVIVDVGTTTTDPVEVADWLPNPRLIETDEAFVVLQERVDEDPGVTKAGDAANKPIAG